jgi:hypothetical protein
MQLHLTQVIRPSSITLESTVLAYNYRWPRLPAALHRLQILITILFSQDLLQHQGTTGSSMIADASAALATNGTFFTFQLGADDVLAYALNGADQADPTRPLTSTPIFTGTYTVALNTVLGANATTKGVVINIPDITSLPHFSLVPYNAIPLDAGTAGVLTTQLANNYNAFLDGMAANMIITSAEATKRKLVYKTGQNAILINDETLTNLTPYMAGPYAGLLPYAIARQTTSADLIPLGTSGILGTAGTFGVLGVSEPLLDNYYHLK